MSTYERRGTALYKYAYNPRALITHLFAGRHNLLRRKNGNLWALIQTSTGDLFVMQSTDEGFTWERHFDIGGYYSRTGSNYTINGPCNALVCYEHFDLIYAFYVRRSVSVWKLYYTYWYTYDPEGTVIDPEQAYFPADGGGESTSGTFTINGLFSFCNNSYYSYFIYLDLDGGNYNLRLRVWTSLITSGYADETTNNWEEIFDCCCDDDNNVYVVGIDVNDGGSAPTVEFVRYREKTQAFDTPVTIDTAPSTDHFFCDLAIARDGYGTLCATWGEMDNLPGSSTVALRYAISKDDGASWDVSDVSSETGYSPYKDAIKAEYTTRNDVIAGYDGGFLITYVMNDDSLTGVAEVTSVTCEADSGGSLNNEYWWLFTDSKSYYIWYDVASGGTDPTPSAPSGGPSTTEGIEVDISTDDTASSVATVTKNAIDGNAAFSASVSSDVVTITHATAGSVKDAEDGNTDWTDAWSVRINGEGTPRTFVRKLATSDGDTYTLGDQIDITNTPSSWNISGARFFDMAEAGLINLEDPGLARCAYQIGEGNSGLQASSKPVDIDQDVLSVGPYPIDYPSEDGSYEVETAGVDELLVTFEIVDTISSNADYYSAGYTGEYTQAYLNVFMTHGTSVRVLKYEPLQNTQAGDRSSYDSPSEYWANIFIDPLSYQAPQRVEDPTNTTDYVEQDIRKVYLPPDLHLSRSFILNNGNFLKRTVWLMTYGGNEYELTQVVPRFINNQITHYECNAYVVGPSYNPFSRVALPSET
jgi:hypothetical protein